MKNVFTTLLLLTTIAGSSHAASLANITRMTPTGLKTFHDFRSKAHHLSEPNNGYAGRVIEGDESSMSYIVRSDNKRSNSVHFLSTNQDGGIQVGEFEVPSTALTPSNSTPLFDENAFGIRYRFETNAGSTYKEMSYQVQKIENRLMRVQTEEHVYWSNTSHKVNISRIDGATLGVAVTRIKVNKEGKTEAVVSTMYLNRTREQGHIVGFESSGNGTSIRVYSIKDGKVTETVYAIGNELEERTSRVLSRSEVDALKFFKVKLKSIPGRKVTEAPSRGVEVELPAAPIAN